MPEFSQFRKSVFVSALESIVVPALQCNPLSSLWVGACFPSAGELGRVDGKDTDSVTNSPAFCNMQCTSVSDNGHGCSLRDCPCEGSPPLHTIHTTPKVRVCHWGFYTADYLVI